MNTILGIIFSSWTVIVCVVFLGVCGWAWSSARREEFDAAANIPFEPDDELHG